MIRVFRSGGWSMGEEEGEEENGMAVAGGKGLH